MTLLQSIQNAELADELYQRAVLKAGYKSRWDCPQKEKELSPILQSAYRAKIQADERMHEAFIRSYDTVARIRD